MTTSNFDFILLRRRCLVDVDGYTAELTELSLADSLRLQRALEAIQDDAPVSSDVTWLRGLLAPQCDAPTDEMPLHVLVRMAAAAVDLGESDIILTDKSGKASGGTVDLPDAHLLRVLDVVAARYGQDPLAIAERYSIRQVLYLFVVSYNALLDDRKMAGAEIKDAMYLNARGMTMSVKAMTKDQKMTYYAALSRRAKNGGK